MSETWAKHHEDVSIWLLINKCSKNTVLEDFSIKYSHSFSRLKTYLPTSFLTICLSKMYPRVDVIASENAVSFQDYCFPPPSNNQTKKCLKKLRCWKFPFNFDDTQCLLLLKIFNCKWGSKIYQIAKYRRFFVAFSEHYLSHCQLFKMSSIQKLYLFKKFL